MKLARTLIIALAAAAASQAQAVVVASDDFNDYNGGASQLNFNGLDGSTVVNGTIDLIRSGDFGIQCAGGSGSCLDLDGSTSNAGDIVTDPFDFAAGEFTLSFDLSGNQRGGSADTVTLTIPGLLNETIAGILSSAPFQTYSYNFTVGTATTASLTLSTAGGDNLGPILDNFVLEHEATDIPEPATLGLLGLGLLGVAARRRRRTR